MNQRPLHSNRRNLPTSFRKSLSETFFFFCRHPLNAFAFWTSRRAPGPLSGCCSSVKSHQAHLRSSAQSFGLRKSDCCFPNPRGLGRALLRQNLTLGTLLVFDRQREPRSSWRPISRWNRISREVHPPEVKKFQIAKRRRKFNST